MKIYIKRESLDRIIWTLYLFVVIFAPPIIPYPHLVLTAISVLLLVTEYRPYYKGIAVASTAYTWLLGMIVVAVYALTIPTAISMFLSDIVDTSHYISLFNRFAVLVVTIIPCSTLLLCKIYKSGYGIDFFLECIIKAGLLEGLTAVLAFLSPAVKDVFISLMRRNTDISLYNNTWYITVRSYGLAGTLVDLYGLGIAIIAGISFFYGVTRKRRYVIYSMLIAVAALLNARTGVIIYLAAVVFSLIYLIATSHIKSAGKAIIALIILYFFVQLVFSMISKNQYTSGWLNSAVTDVQKFLDNATSGSQTAQNNEIAKLFSQRYWQLPDNPIRVFLGTGHSLYETGGAYAHSDVGYINDIWFIGLLGVTFMYGMVVMRSVNIVRRSTNIIFRFAAIYILIAFFIFNIKGAAIGYNPGAASIFLLLFGMSYFSAQGIQE